MRRQIKTTTMNFRFLHSVLPLAALALVAPGSGLAQKVVPGGNANDTYTISEPGSYVLGGNRVMNDPGKHIIKITAHDVTLDLGGYMLSFAGSSSYRAVFIPSSENVEVRNGTIAKGFFGIDAQAGKGLRVVDVRFVSQSFGGIQSYASATKIDRCVVTDAPNHAIWTNGAGNLITDCMVNGPGMGITVDAGSRIIRTVVHGGTVGFTLGFDSTLSDCTVRATTQRGVHAVQRSTIRDLDAHLNAVPVYISAGASVVIKGSRITSNASGVQGAYIDGGGNVIQ